MNNMKRTYKHSEAWLVKHAEKNKINSSKKEAKKEIKNSSKQKKNIKRVHLKKTAKEDKTLDKKLMKAKKLEAKKAARLAKKAVKEQRKAEKLLKNGSKDLLRKANKLINSSKKNINAVKKCTKAYGKLLTETYKLGDVKTLNKITKMFTRLGYEIDDGNINAGTVENTFIATFKLPKVKAAKMPDVDFETNKKDSEKLSEEKNTTETPVVEQTPREIVVEMHEDNESDDFMPSNKDIDSEDNESDDESNDESDDDRVIEDSDFEDISRNADSLFDSSDLRDPSESLREMEEAQRENGDWVD